MKPVNPLMGAFSFFFSITPSFGDEEIICKVKGVGQRIFLLDSGIFFKQSPFKKPKGDFVDWCPETGVPKAIIWTGYCYL